MEQKAPLDVWAKYGADQHDVCRWYLGSRIQATNSCSLYAKLFPALVRSLMHSAVQKCRVSHGVHGAVWCSREQKSTLFPCEV